MFGMLGTLVDRSEESGSSAKAKVSVEHMGGSRAHSAHLGLTRLHQTCQVWLRGCGALLFFLWQTRVYSGWQENSNFVIAGVEWTISFHLEKDRLSYGTTSNS